MKKRENKSEGYVADYAKRELKYMTNVKSVFVWKQQGYKSFGAAATQLMESDPIRRPYDKFSACYRKCLTRWETLSRYSKRGSKEAYNCLLEYLWAYDDTMMALSKLEKTIEDWGMLNNPFSTDKCLISTGRKLGLKEVVKRAKSALKQWQIVKDGLYKFANDKDVYII